VKESEPFSAQTRETTLYANDPGPRHTSSSSNTDEGHDKRASEVQDGNSSGSSLSYNARLFSSPLQLV